MNGECQCYYCIFHIYEWKTVKYLPDKLTMTVTEKHMSNDKKTSAKCLLLSVYKRI